MKLISKQNGVGKDLVVSMEASFAMIQDLNGSIRFGFSTGKMKLPNELRNSTKGAACDA